MHDNALITRSLYSHNTALRLGQSIASSDQVSRGTTLFYPWDIDSFDSVHQTAIRPVKEEHPRCPRMRMHLS